MRRKILFFVILSCFLVSCTNSEKKASAVNALELEARAANEETANMQYSEFMYTGDNAVMFDGENLVYMYYVNEDAISWSDFKEYYLPSLEEQIKASWETMPLLMGSKKNLETIGGSVKYKYIGDQSNKFEIVKIEF